MEGRGPGQVGTRGELRRGREVEWRKGKEERRKGGEESRRRGEVRRRGGEEGRRGEDERESRGAGDEERKK